MRRKRGKEQQQELRRGSGLSALGSRLARVRAFFFLFLFFLENKVGGKWELGTVTDVESS